MGDIGYSIKDLENFTQIKAHTIRIWEQRYGLLTPKRTATNIRFYSEDDLKKILNINLLYTSGYKISKIALLSEAEIIEEAKSKILITEIDKQSKLDKLILLILEFKGDQIKKTIEDQLKSMELEVVYETVVIPLLSKIGQLWQVNSIDIIHEHYFSSIFREFIIGKTDSIKTPSDKSKTAMLFLHENEEHEFSIFLYHYILKKNGYICHNFGQKVPMEEIEIAFNQIKPKMVVTTFTAQISEKNFGKLEKALIKISKKSKVIVSGNQLNYLNYEISNKLVHIKDINEFKTFLK